VLKVNAVDIVLYRWPAKWASVYGS